MKAQSKTKLVVPTNFEQSIVTNEDKQSDTATMPVCLCCGATKKIDFYKTDNPIYLVTERLPWCKSCIRKIYINYLNKYNGRTDLAIYFTCRKLDIPYVHSAYIGVDNASTKELRPYQPEDYFGEYMKSLVFAGRNGWGRCFDDSSGVDLIQGINDYDDTTIVKRRKLTNSAAPSDEFEDIVYDTAYLQSIWGAYSNEDLARLQSEYLDWQEKLISIDTKDIDIIVKQICYQTLDINKSRENGDDVNKKLVTLTSLMNNGGLLEKQNKVVQNIKVVGQRIEDIETFRPIKTVDPDLADVDNLEFLYNAYVGCTARALGKHNACVDKFEEMSAPWAIDLIEDSKQSLIDGEDLDAGGDDG